MRVSRTNRSSAIHSSKANSSSGVSPILTTLNRIRFDHSLQTCDFTLLADDSSSHPLVSRLPPDAVSTVLYRTRPIWCLKREIDHTKKLNEIVVDYDRWIAEREEQRRIIINLCESDNEDEKALDVAKELLLLNINDSEFLFSVVEHTNGDIFEALTASAASASAPLQSITLNEDEIEEKFVRGSGKGGQKVNKTSNKVVLTHRPTGITIDCHDTRSLQQNRKQARKRLLAKLDNMVNGENSKASIKGFVKASKKKKNADRASRRRREEEQRDESLGN